MQGRQSTIVHEGPVFRVETVQYQDPEGSQVRKDVVRHPGAVTVIPVLDSGQLVMIQNQRIAVSNTLLEFCAGSLEPGEPPIQAAHRELREECGGAVGASSAIAIRNWAVRESIRRCRNWR